MIVEIENHLHPTWQRRVIPSLREHFPQLQIFATTHSPFLVAGLDAGQVHRLYRDADFTVRAEAPNSKQIVGWTVDEILRGLMGVQDPTDNKTAEGAQELRELRNQLPLEDKAEEGRRLQRIAELEDMVNSDLSAGGVAAADQQLFEQQFSAALETISSNERSLSRSPCEMHSVGRSPEPVFLSQFRSSLSQWTELQGTDRQRIRGALVQDFGTVCGYCEQPCTRPTPAHDGRNEETIDHFRPRCKFPGLWLDWLNLIYACHRCNQAKNSNWPAPDDAASHLLAQIETRYTGVSEFVNPNAGSHPIG